MIIINGKSYNGRNINISGGKVLIDGKDVDFGDTLQVNIVVEGDLNELQVDQVDTLQIKGNCGQVETTNGSVTIGGSVTGDVRTTNGTVSCGKVGGSVRTTNGSIRHN